MVFYHVGHWKQDYDWVNRTNESLKTPRGQFYAKAMLAELIPPYGAYLRVNDAMEEMDNTLALYGLGYEDVHYLTKTRAFNATGSFASGSLNYVSSNVNRLYK